MPPVRPPERPANHEKSGSFGSARALGNGRRTPGDFQLVECNER